MNVHTPRATMTACFIGYVVQAVVNNFAPLLFLTFSSTYELPLARITLFITFNFLVQISVDLFAPLFIRRWGTRVCIVLAHAFSALGLILLSFLPDLLDPFTGILISVIFYAVGGGLLEVMVSPIMEACPSASKEAAMSLLHSFYCWGSAAVALLSTLFFHYAGIANWRLAALAWALLPLANGFLFLRVPLYPLVPEGEEEMSFRSLVRTPVFWHFVFLMICAGASEQAVSQWLSTFAESELNLDKTIGDLAGPAFFAIMMGSSRAFYGRFGDRIRLRPFLLRNAMLCILSYLLISLSPWPWLSLIGCGLCGLSVGIFWPGTFSLASARLPRGGSALFAWLALGGDIGCAAGPTLAGLAGGGSIRRGILTAILFPLGMYFGCRRLRKPKKKSTAAADA
jgi:fucose permease